jgi:hypothetical protein
MPRYAESAPMADSTLDPTIRHRNKRINAAWARRMDAKEARRKTAKKKKK